MNRAVSLILLFIRMYLLIRLESNASYVPLKGSFGFDLIIPIDSLTVIPFSCSAKNLRRIWQQLLRAISLIKELIFFDRDRQNHNAGMDAFA